MQKRQSGYKLVRCEKKQAGAGRKTGRRCVFSGLMALILLFTALPAFVFPRQSTVLAAKEQTQSELHGTDDGSDKKGKLIKQPIMFEQEISPVTPTREKILVALDAGHGGEDEGTAAGAVLEKDINLKIANAVKEQLCLLGYQVLMVREGDELLSVQSRAQIANDAGADIYVSIHQNSCEERNADISGVEVWYSQEKGDSGSRRLAQLLHNDLALYTKAKERGVVEDTSLYVIRETNMPACLAETGFLSNKKERELLTTEEYQERIAEGIVSGIDLYFFPKTMYLTFDDGPSAKNTEAVLDILKARNIKATFFVIGENVEKHPEVARRIVEEGHTIGIHCYNHDYGNLYQSVDSYVADFEKAKEVVREITGVETKLFRFPGGSINSYNKAVYKEIAKTMTDAGYIYFDWNASIEDACRNNEPERLLKNARESTLGRRRIVLLAHDVIDNTVLCLDEMIEQFPEYQMEPLCEDVEPIVF